MAYIGNSPTSIPFITDSFSGNASTTVFSPLSRAPAGTASIAVFVSGSYQAPGTYTLSGTTITFASPPASGVGNIIVLHLGNGSTTQVPSSGSVTISTLSNDTYTYINAAFTQANTPSYSANSAGSYANSAFLAANTPSYTANSAGSYANSGFAVANSGASYANSAFLAANTPSYTANSAATYANGAFSIANSAFTKANSVVVTIAGTTNQITANAATGNVVLSYPATMIASSNVQYTSLGIGTLPSNTTGEIRATNNITAYYSDDRLKTKLGNIENALDKVKNLTGFYYEANETAQALGYTVRKEVGLSAQTMQNVLPEIVTTAPIDEQYLTIWYERTVPLLVEAIKELANEVEEIKKKL